VVTVDRNYLRTDSPMPPTLSIALFERYCKMASS
jgi:hypothetical protein